jgi:menaquinone-specific isochorismate synthase
MHESDLSHKTWFDSEFFSLGAFFTLHDSDSIVFAKGGSIFEASEITKGNPTHFYLKDFYRPHYLAYSPHKTLTLNRKEAQSLFRRLPEIRIDSYLNDDDLYQKDFQKLKSKFGQELQKVVLISRESYEAKIDQDLHSHLISQAFSFEAGTPYGMWNKDYGMIGSTPELLFKINKDSLETVALAGTAKLGEEAILLDSKKDRHEHDLVIQDITQKISPWATLITVGETGILPFKKMIHLKTAVNATLKEINLTQLTNKFSPTAALGGFPMQSALGFIQETFYGQKYPQRYFGSAFGLVSSETTEFVVAIRNVQWNQSSLFIESGGGVVQESELIKELEEIKLKRGTIKGHYL